MHPEYEFHPIADIFPLMSKGERNVLATDIKANGLRVPIVLYQGKILDGRNRYLACKIADVETQFVQYEGTDPIKYSLSLNLHRRQLTIPQRACIAAELANMRREDTLVQFRSKIESEVNAEHSPQNRTDAQKQATVLQISQQDAAEMIGVSRTTVQEAVALKKRNNLLYEQVKAGKLTLKQADRREHPPNKHDAAWLADMKAQKAANAAEKRKALAEREQEVSSPELLPEATVELRSTGECDSSHTNGTKLEAENIARRKCLEQFKVFVREMSQELHISQREIKGLIRVSLYLH